MTLKRGSGGSTLRIVSCVVLMSNGISIEDYDERRRFFHTLFSPRCHASFIVDYSELVLFWSDLMMILLHF